MSTLPSTISASTSERLKHQFKDWERRHYVHSPEFDEVFDRLQAIDDERREPPRPYHPDWGNGC